MTNHPNHSKQQQAKHTPWPWEYNAPVTRDHSPTIGKGRELIATAWGKNEANARLIAAANAELLEALKLIRRMGSGLIDGEKTAAEVLAKCSAEAGAAIDKAEIMAMWTRIKAPEIADVIGALLICLAALLTPLALLALYVWTGN